MKPVHTISGSLPLSRVAQEIPRAHRRYTNGLLHEAVEQLAPPSGRPAVESERELIQIGVQVRGTDGPLMDTQQPTFQQRDDPVHPRQQVIPEGRLLPHDLMDVAVGRQLAVAVQPIRAHHAAGLHRRTDGTFQGLRRGIGDSPQADAPDAASVRLGRDNDQRLPRRPAAVFARLGPTPVGLIDFYRARQLGSPRPDHGPAELVQPRPRRPVAAQAQGPLEAQGTDPQLLIRHVPHGPEPQPQRLLRILKDRAGQHEDVEATPCAFVPATRDGPCLPLMAAGTLDPIRPAQLDQVRPTGVLGGEAPLEFHQRPRVVVHPRRYYRWGVPASSA